MGEVVFQQARLEHLSNVDCGVSSSLIFFQGLNVVMTVRIVCDPKFSPHWQVCFLTLDRPVELAVLCVEHLLVMSQAGHLSERKGLVVCVCEAHRTTIMFV